ncbi:MAG: metalloregulator ArsR/SmtB family transcription factor [Crocinitomicaceae bacterium]|nr:metalloregulator ArsR/SmtB family transcription factor [Crocinitomicaceae bacterium]
MGLTRIDKYTQEQVDLAQLLKVLGHPARIAIVQSIIRTDSCVCGDLVTEIGLAQSTISQHLKELKHVGIIQGTIEGSSVCYCINKETWGRLESTVNELFKSVAANPDCC